MVYDVILDCQLFAGIKREELGELLDCLGAKRRSYGRDDFIFRVDEHTEYVGIVLDGGANVIQEDFWGNRNILAHIEPGELFGEAFSCAELDRLPVSVIATENSDILLINYRKIVSVGTSTCIFHSSLISNMLGILAEKNILLTRKIEHLSKRTTREKILSFLSAQAITAQSNDLTIALNRQELADYLCVERSALSRELGQMKQDGLIRFSKNHFVLL